MQIDLNLSSLRRTVKQLKIVEDQLNKTLNPVLPTLRQIAELQNIYRDLYGTSVSTDEYEEKTITVNEQPVVMRKSKTKKEALFTKAIVKFPDGAVWVQVKIMMRGGDAMEFFYKDTSLGTFTLKQLGFTRGNTQNDAPNRECELLRMMALGLSYKGLKNFVMTKEELMRACDTKTENGFEKRKSDLAIRLRQITGIHDEPFLPYTPEIGYLPKFELLPEAILQDDGELRASGHEYIDDMYGDSTDDDEGIEY